MLNKYTIQDMRLLAKKKGGKCLSTEYINTKTKLTWKCKNNHIWDTPPGNIIAGKWCRHCAGNIKKELSDFQNYAKSKEGKCLSSEYLNSKSKMWFKCKNGHTWEIGAAAMVRDGRWCPKCSGSTLSITDMQKSAKDRGGKCLSKTYVNSRTKLIWECSLGHRWNSSPDSVYTQKTWCPECARNQPINMSDKELLLKISEVQTELGYVPSQDEWRKRKLFPSINTFKRRFGNWGNAVKKAGLIPNSFGQGRSKDLDIASLIEKLINFSNKIKRVPKAQDLDNDDEVAGKSTYIMYFGTYQNALFAAGLANRPSFIFLEDAQKLAKMKNGKCLSKSAYSKSEKLEWQCESGHKWHASFKEVDGGSRPGTWCKKCGFITSANKQRDSLKVFHEIAKKKGGKCLSREYLNSKSKLEFQCKDGHIWKSAASQIKQLNTWCPYCAGNRKLTIDEINKKVKDRGGICLSANSDYKTNASLLSWRCSQGHEWRASYVSAFHGAWCPSCNKYNPLGEKVLRDALKQIFKKPFKKVKPDWLRNTDGVKLELDGYNEELGIAFEHHGSYHYKFIKRFHGTKSNFIKRQRVDKEKEEMVKEHGVKLIIVPEIFSMTKLVDLKEVIEKEFNRLKIHHPKGFKKLVLDFKGPYRQDLLDDLKAIIQRHGGTLHSKIYLGSAQKLDVTCKNKHDFKITVSQVRAGSWCAYCKGIKIYGNPLKEVKEIAIKKGGKLLSKTYVNNNTKLELDCGNGHKWKTMRNQIVIGRWCPYCAGTKIWGDPLLKLREIAKKKGGKCLAKKYISSKTPLKFECKLGHTWKAAPSSVKSGTWCGKCKQVESGLNRRMPLKNISDAIKEKGGKLITKTYRKDRKVEVDCGKGHVWLADPRELVSNRKRWCPNCAGNLKKTINDMQELAQIHGGVCISKVYLGANKNLKWRCKEGHVFNKTPSKVRTGVYFCSECAGTKKKYT